MANDRKTGRFVRFENDERGATAIEYALIAALMVMVMIVGLRLFGAEVGSIWSYVSTTTTGAIDEAVGESGGSAAGS